MGDSRPVYQRIADDLRRRIDEGELSVGDRIPSRAELKRAYAASDQTVDRAVRVLKAAGYASGQFGRGVFVSDRVPIGALVRSTAAVDSPLAARLSVPDAGSAGGAPDLAWEAVSTTTAAPADIAVRLGLTPGERVMCTRYEYLADRRPLQLATSWEPLALTEGTDVVFPERGPYARRGVRGRFAAIGIRVVHAREIVGSRPATSPEAEALGCAPGQCVTAVERTHYDAEERPVETSDTVVLGDRWRLEYDIAFTQDNPAMAQDSAASA
ncbi:GntR family transcriptional regulator [Streptomyces hainanensis]|uniref:GntR family transcriptional regulator n=1 Tax=Streptomyces hainanensis TaxID=402648 RepID=A0A4R4TEC9_9ACTN|nr:GntR family transcriptional regulator [Streptomyces hainanensis]TDC75891.1 GntR family transcriptional regulator [Streptomyces hainanensis]